MLEAMLAAKPVVAARAGSAPELVVDGETGALVPVDGPADLTAPSRQCQGPRRPGELGRPVSRARPDGVLGRRMTERTLAVYLESRVGSRSRGGGQTGRERPR